MEISSVLCSGLPSIPCAFLPSTRTSLTQPTSATTLVTDPPPNAPATAKRSHLKACLSNKYAVLGVQQSPSLSSASLTPLKINVNLVDGNNRITTRMDVVSMSMLAPRKSWQRRKKVEFKDAADEANKKNWWRMMEEIEATGSALTVLRHKKTEDQSIPRDLVLGTLVRFKQLKKWNYVSEILEWLRLQNWWDSNEMDSLMLITAYGKQGDFNKAERILTFMNKKGHVPCVVSHAALMEAYGRGGRCNNAEAIFRRMQSSGPEPSALTYQIILKIFAEGNKFEAEEIFATLLDDKISPLKPDQKMFHMMIYMYKKAGNHGKARELFALIIERRVPQSTVTYNSLMSFESNYKEVSKIYEQGRCPDHF
ncbi:hypothetical protein SLA2020_013460 [Shorea laevis]